jgi:hypothetical protein
LTIVAFLFEKADWLPEYPPDDQAYPISMIVEVPKGSHPLTCCAFADSSYFLRYAERFATTLRQTGVSGSRVTLGLINPSEEARALGLELARAHNCGIVAVSYAGDCLPEFAASVVAAQSGPAADRFFQVAERYLRAKLCEVGPLWTFNQVALHRAVAAARSHGDHLANLNAVLGGAVLPRLFTDDHKIPFTQRSLRRSNAGLACSGLDEDLRPTWTQKG